MSGFTFGSSPSYGGNTGFSFGGNSTRNESSGFSFGGGASKTDQIFRGPVFKIGDYIFEKTTGYGIVTGYTANHDNQNITYTYEVYYDSKSPDIAMVSAKVEEKDLIKVRF